MTPRQPDHWQSLAEQRIRAAQQAGEFDQLPGFGQPIPGIDDPLDENWWLRQKLRREEVSGLPPILEARRDRERTLAHLPKMADVDAVRQTLIALNERIRRAHYSTIPGPGDGVQPVDVEEEIARWAAQRGA